MNRFLILVSLLFLFKGFSQSETSEEGTREFYENGDLKSMLPKTYDQEEGWEYSGTIKLYRPNGILFLQGQLENNGFEGLCTFYDENEIVNYQGSYKNREKRGEWIVYDDKADSIFSERGHDYINLLNVNQYDLEDADFPFDKRQMYFLNQAGDFKPYDESQNGEKYRVITFKENQPDFKNGFKEKNKDLIVTRYRWGGLELKFRKRVKMILVDYYDDGCSEPATSFVLKNRIRKTVGRIENMSFYVKNAVFSAHKMMRKTKYFKLQQCEGYTGRIVIVYE
jgi:antitoxin component YwqK of YwqJK toxin-antitoxin module